MTYAATEKADVDAALERLDEQDAFLDRLLVRMRPYFALEPPARVLDVGAAQGGDVTAYKRRGFDVVGVEPWEPAIEVSKELSARTGIETSIAHGWAEELPFEDASFDFVHAYSVMEHVDDPVEVFREAHRVLAPGGAFYFSTTSKLSPRQAEIAWFPLFPWYPERAQRAIMDWAIERRPGLVGHTTRPAYHWFKHGEVRRDLRSVGFDQVVDRWQLRRGESEGFRAAVLRGCSENRALRFLGNLAVPGMDYLAVKPGSGSR